MQIAKLYAKFIHPSLLDNYPQTQYILFHSFL